MSSGTEDMPLPKAEAVNWRSPPVLAVWTLGFGISLMAGWSAVGRLVEPEKSPQALALLSGGGSLPFMHAALESATSQGEDVAEIESQKALVQAEVSKLDEQIATETKNVADLKKRLEALMAAQGSPLMDTAGRKRLAEAKLAVLKQLSQSAEALLGAKKAAADMAGMAPGGGDDLNEKTLAAWQQEWEALTAEAAGKIKSARETYAELKVIQDEWTAWSQQPGNTGNYARMDEAKTRLAELDTLVEEARKLEPEARTKLMAAVEEAENRLEEAIQKSQTGAAAENGTNPGAPAP